MGTMGVTGRLNPKRDRKGRFARDRKEPPADIGLGVLQPADRQRLAVELTLRADSALEQARRQPRFTDRRDFELARAAALCNTVGHLRQEDHVFERMLNDDYRESPRELTDGMDYAALRNVVENSKGMSTIGPRMDGWKQGTLESLKLLNGQN